MVGLLLGQDGYRALVLVGGEGEVVIRMCAGGETPVLAPAGFLCHIACNHKLDAGDIGVGAEVGEGEVNGLRGGCVNDGLPDVGAVGVWAGTRMTRIVRIYTDFDAPLSFSFFS